MTMQIPNNILRTLNKLNENGYQAYIVGGCVRDFLLGKEPSDFDICTNARPETVMEIFEHAIPTGIKHGTITVIDEEPIEITTFRTEGSYVDHRHPDLVTFVADVKEDLARRDFTINAMAYHPGTGIVDPFHGQEDLKNGIIRAVGDPSKRFEEDALRMIRAHRFAAKLHFSIEDNTQKAIDENAHFISRIAVERLYKELIEILRYDPYQIEKMTDLWKPWIPQLEDCLQCEQHTKWHDTNVLHHSLRAVKLLDPFDETLAITLLLHDIAKPYCKSTKDGIDHFYGHPEMGERMVRNIVRDLKLTSAQQKEIPKLILFHDVRPVFKPSRVYKLTVRDGWKPDQIYRLFEVQRGDILAHSAYGAQTIDGWEKFYAFYEECRKTRPMELKDLAVDGRILKEEFHLEGNEIGEALNLCLEYAFYHPEKNNVEDLLKFTKKMRPWKGRKS